MNYLIVWVVGAIITATTLEEIDTEQKIPMANYMFFSIFWPALLMGILLLYIGGEK